MKPIFILFICLNWCGASAQNPRTGEQAVFSKKTQLISFDSNSELTYEKLNSHTKPTAIFFWLSSCGPCIKELNVVKQIKTLEELKELVDIMVVSDDQPSNYAKAKAIASRNNWPFNMYFDKGYHLRTSLLNRWYGVPQVMVLDKDKKIILHKIGYKNGDAAKVIAKLVELSK